MQHWGTRTNDQLDTVSGKRDQPVCKFQECYGVAGDEADRQVMDWEAQYCSVSDKATTRRTRKNAGAAQH